MVVSIAAFFVSALGLIWLYRGWRERSAMPIKRWLPAWLLIIASVWLWSRAHGWEFGMCYTLIAIALQAWLLIVLKREPMRVSRHDRQPNELSIPWGRVVKSIPNQFLIFLFAVPLAGVASLFITVMLTSMLPWNPVNLMALGIYLMPLLWGVAAYWVCADSQKWRPVVTFIAIIAFESLVVYGV